MGPVLKDIKRVFDAFKANGNKMQSKSELDEIDRSVCEKYPFDNEDRWMYWYLFPEVAHLNRKRVSNTFDAAPCWYCSEEQVLRIMAEHGLL